MKPVKQLATIIQRVESLHQRYLYDNALEWNTFIRGYIFDELSYL